MAAAVIVEGYGATFTGLGDTAFVGNVVSIDLPEVARTMIESTHLLSDNNAKEFVASAVYDSGELTMEIQYDANNIPPINGAAGILTITDVGLDTFICNAYVQSIGMPRIAVEEMLVITITFKLTGAVSGTMDIIV